MTITRRQDLHSVAINSHKGTKATQAKYQADRGAGVKPIPNPPTKAMITLTILSYPNKSKD